MKRLEVRHEFAAPVQTVWNRYTDHVSWTQWAGLGHVELARTGTPPPNGVGCVRKISNFGFAVYEEVVSFDPPARMTYRLVRGAVPIKDHLGEVIFEPCNGGTRVTWRCQFNPSIPGAGGVMQAVITRMFRNALAALARDLGA